MWFHFARYAVAVALTALVAPSAQCAYKFTKVADTNTVGPADKFFDLDYFPAISNGSVTFLGQGLFGAGTEIFSGNGGPITAIANVGDPAPDGKIGLIDMYDVDSGTATFHAYFGFNSGQGIFTKSGGALTTIVKKGDPAPSGSFTTFEESAISNGKVAFRGTYDSGMGVFTGSGGPLDTVAKTGDPAPQGVFTFFGEPALSGNDVAYYGRFGDEVNPSFGIFVNRDGLTTTIAKTGDPAPTDTFYDVDFPTTSEGVVAFLGYFSGQTGLFTGTGGPLTTIVKTGDPAPIGSFTALYFFPSISHGEVAFRAFYNNDNDEGIFVSDGSHISDVIKTGDLLFGFKVTSAVLYRFGLDNDGSGRLAFYYQLKNGTRGIAIATPVPEPSTWALSAGLVCRGSI